MRSEEKLIKILRELAFRVAYSRSQHEDLKEPLHIERFALKHLIQEQLEITDTHTINAWIDQLISSRFISMNPHTSLSSKQHIYKPSPNTRYFIEDSTISEFLAPHTQQRQTQLTLSYGDSP
jgi:hypothetical protein